MGDFEEIYKQAQDYFKEEDYIEAEKLYLELNKMIPEGCADIYNNLGMIKHEAGDIEQSIIFFKKALKINPHYTEASLNLTIAYNDIGEYESAASVFSQAAQSVSKEDGKIKIDPFLRGKLANEHFNLGNIYFEAGLLDDAEAQYRKSLSMRPNFVDVITRLGVTLREKHLYSEAIDTLRMAAQVKSNYTPAMIQLGITYYSNGFIDLALKEWEAVKKIDPEGKEVQVYLSIAEKKVLES